MTLSSERKLVIQVLMVATGTYLAMLMASIGSAFVMMVIMTGLGHPMPALDDPQAFEAFLKLPAPLLVSVVAVSTTVGLVATIMSFHDARRPWGLALRRRWALTAPRSGWNVVWVTLGMLGLGNFMDTVVFGLGLENYGTLADLRQVFSDMSWQGRLGAAVVLGVFPGVAEELFFRGYMLRRLSAVDPRIAWILSSVVFGVFHSDLVHAPMAAGLGFYLGWCVLRTGSLWIGIIAHIVNNFVATLSAGWVPSPEIRWVAGGMSLILTGVALRMVRGQVTDPWTPFTW